MDRDSVRRAIVVGAVVALVYLAGDTAAAQCAMCRRALQSPEGQQLAAALRSGILVLLAAPFTVFAVVAVLAVKRFGRPPAPPHEVAADN
jgi:threonine/homoserine/homoserine lactone efflux protein